MNTKVYNWGILPSVLRQNVKKWYDSHREVYKKFLRLFKRLFKGDVKFFKTLLTFLQDCMPSEWKDLLGNIDKENIDNKDLFAPYYEWICDCLANKSTILVNVSTLERFCVPNNDFQKPKNDELFINLELIREFSNLISSRNIAIINSAIEDCIRSMRLDYKEEQDSLKKIKRYRVFLFYGISFIFIYILMYTPEFLKNCYTKSTRHSNFCNCLLCFFIFGHGMPKMAQQLTSLINNDNGLGVEFHDMKDGLIKAIVGVSVNLRYEKKEYWKKMANQDYEDADVVNNALSHIKSRAGRNTENRILEELLIGNKVKLLRMIDRFIADKKNTTIDLACLYFILTKTSHINCRYETFHKAIRGYASKGRFGVPSAPRTQYSELLKYKEALYDDSYYKDKKELHGKKWERMRARYAKWVPRFHDID